MDWEGCETEGNAGSIAATGIETIINFIMSVWNKSTPTRRILMKYDIQGDTKKREILKNPTKIEEIQQKKCIDRN
jgi:hypothetical protein